jgi:hypothetical protein
MAINANWNQIGAQMTRGQFTFTRHIGNQSGGNFTIIFLKIYSIDANKGYIETIQIFGIPKWKSPSYESHCFVDS